MNFAHHGIPENFNLGVVENALLHNIGCAQRITAVDQIDLGCVGGEEECFFQSRIAAAHNRDFFIFEEESIAGCAP